MQHHYIQNLQKANMYLKNKVMDYEGPNKNVTSHMIENDDL